MKLSQAEIITENLDDFTDEARSLAEKVEEGYLRMCCNSLAKRYGFELTDIAYQELCEDIRSQKNKVVNKILDSVDTDSKSTALTAFEQFLADDEF